MADLLTIWLGAQAVGFVFKPILDKLAGDVAADWVKDFCKESIKSVLSGREKKWSEPVGKALAQFLVEFEQELIGAGVEPAGCAGYQDPLGRFTNDPAFRSALGSVVLDAEATLDGFMLNDTWTRFGFEALPSEFRWVALARRVQGKARAIAREYPELRELVGAQNLQRIADTAQQTAPLPPGFDLARYAEAMREKYGRLRLESLDVTGAYYRELQLWRVFIPQNLRECQEYLPRVFELPKEHFRRLREAGELDIRNISADDAEQLRRRYVEQTPRNALELVDDPALPLLVILGDPGSGKSSLLQALVLRWAEAVPADLPSLPLPLLIELRLYAQARQKHDGIRSFLEYLHSAPGVVGHLDQHELKRWLDAGRAHLYFDGLDEVFDPALREEIVSAIHAFSNDFPRARIVVTSRPIGYKGEALRHAGFRHFMLQELDDEQISSFLNKWYTDTYNPRTEAQERDEKHARLGRAIQDSRPIRELAGNPLLLTMMAILNRNQDLPRDRASLYQECSRLLLYQWKVEEALRADPDLAADAAAIGLEEKRIILRRLAREMQASPEGLAGNIIAAGRLESIVVDCIRTVVHGNPHGLARALIRQLRERNFILCFVGGNSYAFVHRTFLEYFCADDLRGRFDYEKSIDLDYLRHEVFGAHWSDERWHEVLCLLAGMTHPASVAHLVKHLLAQKDRNATCHHIFLAARCVGEVRNRSELGDAAPAALAALQALVHFDLDYFYQPWDPEAQRVSNVRTKAISLCALVWSAPFPTMGWLKARAQQDENWDVRQAAVQELARGWKEDPDTLPWLKARAQQDENWDVRQAAVQELARGWKEAPDTLPILKAREQQDENWAVRQAAVQELARGWKEDPDTLPWLKARAQQEEDGAVRQAAVQESARGWKEDPDTLPILKARAQQDEDGAVRQAAVQELARGWKEDPDTLPILKARAQQDENRAVRQAAVQELARGWKEDPDTLPWLKARAQQDENWVVRQAAVRELARGWKEDPDTLPILKARAQQDENWVVRQAAVRELARGWKEDPDTLPILKARAQQDENGAVRQAAVQELARGWKEDPDTLPILKARAQQDENWDVRQAAVRELARSWKEDPDTLPILKARAQQDKNGAVRQAAVQELARGWKEDPDTLPILKARAQQDADNDVLQAAVQELARGWKEDPDTLPWLKARAQQEEDGAVRQAAVQESARGWKEDPDTLPILKARAQQDENWAVRQAAVRELARGWKEDPDTLPILKARAQQDENWAVRQAAVQELARGWKEDPDTLPILKARAQQDENEDVRQAAVRELARGWKDDPEVQDILTRRRHLGGSA